LTPASPEPKRTTSDPTVSSAVSSPNTISGYPKRRKPLPTSTSHSGRHSNDWLFGGFSVSKTVKSMIKEEDDDLKDK
jgi:hypothetical protein